MSQKERKKCRPAQFSIRADVHAMYIARYVYVARDDLLTSCTRYFSNELRAYRSGGKRTSALNTPLVSAPPGKFNPRTLERGGHFRPGERRLHRGGTVQHQTSRYT